jgi:hypothetical protein
LQEQQTKIKQRLVERGLPNDIADLKERFEKSKSDVDLRNALQLENALKLHELFEELLENPIIADAIDNSSEGLNELLSAWMKIMGNAVTSAGESIPILGEFFVLENMLRRFLYNISDGSKAAKKIEDSFEEPINILGLMGEDPNSESNANTNDNETNDDKISTQQTNILSSDVKEKYQKMNKATDNYTDFLQYFAQTSGTPEEKEKIKEELKQKLDDARNEYDEALIKIQQHHQEQKTETTNGESGETTTEATNGGSGETTPAQMTSLNNMNGGAINAMQHRIHTSIHDFLQSSILNVW